MKTLFLKIKSCPRVAGSLNGINYWKCLIHGRNSANDKCPPLHPRFVLDANWKVVFATYAQSFWLARLRLLETPAFELSRLLPRWSFLMCLTTAVALNACWDLRKEKRRQNVLVHYYFSSDSKHFKLLKMFSWYSRKGIYIAPCFKIILMYLIPPHQNLFWRFRNIVFFWCSKHME